MNNYGQLVEAVIRQQFGPIAGDLAGLLRTCGNLTLKELADRCPQYDAAKIRGSMARLIRHALVSFDSGDQLYQLEICEGYCRFVFPVIAEHIRRKFGETGELIALVLYSHGAMTTDEIVRSITQEQPQWPAAAIKDFTEQMIRGNYICNVSPLASRGTAQPPSKKKPTEEALAASSAGNLPSVQLNYVHALFQIRSDLCLDLAKSLIVGAGVAALMNTLLQSDSNRQPSRDKVTGLLRLPQISSGSSASNLAKTTTNNLQANNLSSSIAALASEEVGFLTRKLAKMQGSETEWGLDYNRMGETLKLQRAELFVTARFGQVGMRVVRLLFEKHVLDEKQIAEDTICSISELRPVLSAMQKDGILRLLEFPKSAAAERLPQNSVFLWELKKEVLFGIVQQRVIKAAEIVLGKSDQLLGAGNPQMTATTQASAFALLQTAIIFTFL
jgi:hypothetical protein